MGKNVHFLRHSVLAKDHLLLKYSECGILGFVLSPLGQVDTAGPGCPKGSQTMCLGSLLLCDTFPEWKILESCCDGGAALGDFLPSFASFSLLATATSRKQGRTCRLQPDMIQLTQGKSSEFDGCVW